MINDQNYQSRAHDNNRKKSKSRHSTSTTMNRIDKIRDKRTIYPESTLNKIVFISNMEGNGFQRQNIYLYDVPAHIDLQQMLSGINMVCFNQWRQSLKLLQAQPLLNYDLFQKILTVISLVAILLFIFFISMQQPQNTEILAFIFLALIILVCVCSFLFMTQKRVQINKDACMMKAIKKELMRLNQNERLAFSQRPRFTWTCHKECIWIACQFH